MDAPLEVYKENLDSNCTRMLWAILKKSWKLHSTKQQMYSHLPSILKTIQIRWTRPVGHCRRSQDELISNVLLWTLSHGHASVGPPVRNYLQWLCTNTGCSLEDLQEVMDDREICASSATSRRWWYINTQVDWIVSQSLLWLII